MYSILGPVPGESAATSFCKGAEMSMKRRAMRSSLPPFLARPDAAPV
jgi:hypothetical protein